MWDYGLYENQSGVQILHERHRRFKTKSVAFVTRKKVDAYTMEENKAEHSFKAQDETDENLDS